MSYKSMDATAVMDNQKDCQLLPLSDLSAGSICKIVKINLKGPILKRIVDMGIINGAILLVERYAPLGDPMELKINNCHIAVRLNEASNILVEKLKS